MKYAELIEFEPIESVVQLREADAEAEARRLVETFVISERMAEQLTDLVFPQLQFDRPADNKGLLVVGNYGTGKSHLMAMISAVAEHGTLREMLKDPAVADSAAAVAGRFQVIRAEIGSTTMSLRDILCGVLEDGLAATGINYEFPATAERHENKTAFVEMMTSFQQEYPDQGLLLVLDELLDYLRARKDQELSLDLTFLREVGEISKSTKFRFVAGLQESLFDNPRFQFVAEPLRRVKDRFEQVRIVRTDVAYVVSERLLKKDPRQQGRIREHLVRFAPLYGSMNERLDEFVRLFPVHPAFLDTFERIYVAEKREVLKTLSAAMRMVIDDEIPADQPGLIAYDSYWRTLKENPSFRAENDIREVIDKSDVLEARIKHAFTRPQYRPVALRIIDALAVHRLTTDDIYAPLGPTAEELRDDLCLLLPVPERDAEFLKTVVETVLRAIVKTVSGQFLSCNRENGQYYLDLKKDVDFDSLIEKKAESLSDYQLDRHYFDALQRVILEDPEKEAYVAGYRIWEHELEWRERKAGRGGYLFFGAPNERSTAQPPRDFYLYFLPPFEPPFYKDGKKSDEVFFCLEHPDKEFGRTLELYAGAREQAASASGANKKIYLSKADDHRRTLTAWLREHMTTAFEVRYQGRSLPLAQMVRGQVPAGLGRVTVREFVDAAGSACLAPRFADQAPDYPVFTVAIGAKNRKQATQEALRWIAGSLRNRQGAAVLDALDLLDGEELRPRRSRYAKQVLELLSEKNQRQVLNRAELVREESGIPYWLPFRLEEEFLVVVLAALVHSGDLVLSVPGRKIDAASIDQLTKLGIGEVAAFKHVERPRDLPLGALQELYELVGLPKGLIINSGKRDKAVRRLQGKVAELVNKVVVARQRLPGLVLWGKPILADHEQENRRQRLAELKTFLESLQAFNNPGKLKNFPHDADAVAAQGTNLEVVREIEELGALVQEAGPQASYLDKAEAVLGAAHGWVERADEERGELLAKLSSPRHRTGAAFLRQLRRALTGLRTEYQEAYLAAHARARLRANDESRKAALIKDPRLAQLRKLAGVEMMPAPQLHDFQNRLHGLKACYALTRQDLDADPICPHPGCRYRPVEERSDGRSAHDVLEQLDGRLDQLACDWTAILVSNLRDPTVEETLGLLGGGEGKEAIEGLRRSEELPESVSPALVKALQEVLSGLQKVVLEPEVLRAALAEGGVPCTVAELKGRFEGFVAGLTEGKDVSKVRVVIE